MKILGIIPSRFNSTRFPGKALANINGKPMVWRVYDQACKARELNDVVVATDHERIFETVRNMGGNAIMTQDDHPSGTDRCYEAYQKFGAEYDYIINIQGDEPFIHPEQIDECAKLLDGTVELATLVTEIKNNKDLLSPNTAKVIFNYKMEAMYFSREALPHLRGIEKDNYLKHQNFYKHVSIYAYRADILKDITKLPVSKLEKAESLEQLRWLENGLKIKIGVTEFDSFGIDTPEDLENALKLN